MLLNMQKSALEHRAGGKSQFVENKRKNAPPLEVKRKKTYLARGRIGSERVADFSQVLRPRVAGLRRAGTSKVWGTRRDAWPTAVYV